MLFNSLEFLLFFSLIFLLFFSIQHRYRWILLLCASYFFYGYWEAKYLLLISATTLVNYFVGNKISKCNNPKRKKSYLYISILINIGSLFIFKYFNFFINSASDLIRLNNPSFSIAIQEIVLPVGISFYTFQTLGYTIDIYNGKMKPEKHLGIFALFVSFFPQLVAGPIERASHLLPQFYERKKLDFDRISSGLSLMLWGFFKKIVIADRLSIVVNEIYNNPSEYYGYTLIMATIFFAFQIYCDFSGYSDIAIGAAKVLGFNLMRNFNYPYFASSISNFWKRWHISLSTWFQDYVYIPLGGNRTVKWRWYYNLFITFLISGIWHGANWTFIIWGAFHGFLLIIEKVFQKEIKNQNKALRFLFIFITFALVCIGWVFFRANSINDALIIFEKTLDLKSYSVSQLSLYIIPTIKNTAYSIDILLSYGLILFLFLSEYLFSKKINFDSLDYYKYRLPIYIAGIISILLFGAFEKNEFIYFQF